MKRKNRNMVWGTIIVVMIFAVAVVAQQETVVTQQGKEKTEIFTSEETSETNVNSFGNAYALGGVIREYPQVPPLGYDNVIYELSIGEGIKVIPIAETISDSNGTTWQFVRTEDGTSGWMDVDLIKY